MDDETNMYRHPNQIKSGEKTLGIPRGIA